MPLSLVIGDITDVYCDAIVNCTNEKFEMTGAVAQRIAELAGDAFKNECKNIVGCKLGHCVFTSGCGLQFKNILHVASPTPNHEDANHLLASCYKNAIAKARQLGCTSIAFPVISSGGNGFPLERALNVGLRRISVELSQEDLTVYLVFHTKEDFEKALPIYQQVFGAPYIGFTGIPNPKNEIKTLGLIPTVVSRLRRHDIIYIDHLCTLSASTLFADVGLSFRMFKRIVNALHEKGLYLEDYDADYYDSINEYLKEKEGEWIEFETQKAYKRNLENCELEYLEELNLPSRIVSLLNKQSIFTVKDLLSKSRRSLLITKQLGQKGVMQIANALNEHELFLYGDRSYECEKCGTSYPDVISTATEHFCPSCSARLERIKKMDRVQIKISEPEYSSFERLSSGFILYANIKNVSDELLKVKLKEFYIESNGRQIARKYHLQGYYFDEESIMPMSTRTSAMIWDTSSFAQSKLQEGDCVFITLSLLNDKKTLMYKFKYQDDEMKIEDYFED